MDRGARWTVVHGDHKRVGQDLAIKQQRKGKLILTYY